jgi:hypothetical protein
MASFKKTNQDQAKQLEGKRQAEYQARLDKANENKKPVQRATKKQKSNFLKKHGAF